MGKKTGRKASSLLNRDRRNVKGLIIKWCDNDPLSEDRDSAKIYCDVFHRNKLLEIVAPDVYARNKKPGIKRAS